VAQSKRIRGFPIGARDRVSEIDCPNQLKEFFLCADDVQEHFSRLIYFVPEAIIHMEAVCLVIL